MHRYNKRENFMIQQVFNIQEIITKDQNGLHDLHYYMKRDFICIPIKFFGRTYTLEIKSSLGQEKIMNVINSFFKYIKERESRNLILPILKKDDVFVDVGACWGSWSLPATALGANTIAFEPDQDALDIFYHQIEINNFSDRIRVIKEFVTDSTNSIDSLDLKRCKLIKIDVEGMEFEVLNGAVETIQRFKPNILVELHTPGHGHEPSYEIEFIKKIYPGYKSIVFDEKANYDDVQYWHIYHYK